jgi:adenine specific DNA methylase Mod
MGTEIRWEDANFLWNSNPYLWDEVELVTEVIGGGDVIEAIKKVDKLPEDKKKRFVRLVCKVKGIETYSGQKEIKEDIKITTEDIKLVAKKVLGIELTVENIHV